MKSRIKVTTFTSVLAAVDVLQTIIFYADSAYCDSVDKMQFEHKDFIRALPAL